MGQLHSLRKQARKIVKIDLDLAAQRYRLMVDRVMKKNDPRWDDTRRIEGSGNVFVDMGFDPAEAEVMRLRAEVMLRMEQLLREKGWTQAEAARRLGVTQPRISRLVKGRWEDFSLDMLLTLAARAGLHPRLRLAA